MSHPDRPNILFIMTDQHRFDCVGANGNRLIDTPNLDALAEESANFTSCYVQAPVCVPSRQTFFTGRYPRSHKNRVNYTPLNSSETLLQQHLKNESYQTGFVGKLHYWPPSRESALSTGFDMGLIHDAGPTDSNSDYVKWLESTAPQFADSYRECASPTPDGNPFTAAIPNSYHETTWCGEHTRGMMEQFAQQQKPFFLFSSYWRPHSPFEVPKPWASKYNDCDIPLPASVDMEYMVSLPIPVQKLALRGNTRDFEIPRDTLLWMYRSYYAAITQIDYEVGQTLATLENLGLRDDTVVVFTSDHGDFLCEHGINGKNAFYESAVHVPLMIRFPNVIEPGKQTDLVESTDLFSTLFDLCDLDTPTTNQGRSLAGAIASGRTDIEYEPRRYVFAENVIPEVITAGSLEFTYEPDLGVGGIKHPDAKMVRSQRWKYCYYVDSKDELFDMTDDPEEMNNLAQDENYRGVVSEMRTALLDWLITSDETEQIAPKWCV